MYKYLTAQPEYQEKIKKITALLKSDKCFLDHIAEIYEDYVGEDFTSDEGRSHG